MALRRTAVLAALGAVLAAGTDEAAALAARESIIDERNFAQDEGQDSHEKPHAKAVDPSEGEEKEQVRSSEEVESKEDKAYKSDQEDRHEETSEHDRHQRVSAAKEGHAVKQEKQQESPESTGEAIAKHYVKEYDPNGQGESAESTGEAYAKHYVKEYEPKGQGESAESVGEAYAKHAVKEYEPSEAKEQGESAESTGEAYGKNFVKERASTYVPWPKDSTKPMARGDAFVVLAAGTDEAAALAVRESIIDERHFARDEGQDSHEKPHAKAVDDSEGEEKEQVKSNRHEEESEHVRHQRVSAAKEGHVVKQEKRQESPDSTGEAFAKHYVKEYEPKEQGESAESVGEAYAKHAVKEYEPREAKEQGESAESVGKAYAKHFVKEYEPSEPKEQGESAKSVGEAYAKHFIHQYAQPYMHYVDASERVAQRFPDAPHSASACHTIEQLKAWRGAQEMMTDAYVPKAYSHFSDGATEQQYKDNKARIEKEIADAKPKAQRVAKPESDDKASDSQPSDDEAAEDASPVPAVSLAAVDVTVTQTQPGAVEPSAIFTQQYAGNSVPLPLDTHNSMAWRDTFVRHFAGQYQHYIQANDRLVNDYKSMPARPSECKDVDCLKKWRGVQHLQVDSYVPVAYRPYAAGSIEQAYADSKANIDQAKEGAAQAAQPVAGDAAMATKVAKLAGAVAAIEMKSGTSSASVLAALTAVAAAVGAAVAMFTGGRRRASALDEGLLGVADAPLAAV